MGIDFASFGSDLNTPTAHYSDLTIQINCTSAPKARTQSKSLHRTGVGAKSGLGRGVRVVAG